MVFAAAVSVVAIWPGEKEPEYQGKKLNQWIGLMKPHPRFPGASYLDLRGRATVEGMNEAVRHMGTNAVPCLVRWIGYETPGWKRRVSQSCTNLPAFIANSRFGRWLHEDRKAYRADSAERILCSYGPEILPWVSELSRIEEDHKRPIASHRAWMVLAVIAARRYHGTNDPSTGFIVLYPQPGRVSREIDVPPGFEPLFGGAMPTNVGGR
jgi:hypothetical protein